MTLRRATPAQLPGLCRALEAAGLPFSDLTPTKLEHFLIDGVGDAITHCAGVEVFGDVGLVRSLVVVAGRRYAGQGGSLLAALEAHAREQDVRVLYLLTTTAAPFFARHGYAVIERDHAPAALQATAEFAALCPASAICMTKILNESMTGKTFNVLVLCTGNSARSIMAEALINVMGDGRVRAYSAGSHPSGTVNPLAVEQIAAIGYPLEKLRSKSWDEFATPDAPAMDFVITVCDNAAGEVCPIWPGHPLTAHWGIEDPAAITGSDDERRRVFAKVYRQILNRVQRFVSLPLAGLDRQAIKRALDAIGKAKAENA